eukprot:6491314-Amphidinium_carterae.1
MLGPLTAPMSFSSAQPSVQSRTPAGSRAQWSGPHGQPHNPNHARTMQIHCVLAYEGNKSQTTHDPFVATDPRHGLQASLLRATHDEAAA